MNHHTPFALVRALSAGVIALLRTFPASSSVVLLGLIWGSSPVKAAAADGALGELGGGGACSFTVGPLTQWFDGPGGAGSVTVLVNGIEACSWTAVSNVPWITVSSGSSGSTSGTVNFTVAQNTGTTRSGTITVAGYVVTVSQGTVGCTFSLTPTSQAFSSSGGTGTATLSTQTGCGWTATSDAAFVTLGAPNGTGSAAISYTVQANPTSASRGTTLRIGGKTLSVTQAGRACSYVIGPTSFSLAAAGATGNITVLVSGAGACGWTLATQSTWISVLTPSGTTSNTARFTVPSNSGGARTGSLTFTGDDYTATIAVSQAAGSGTCTYGINPTSQSVGSAGGSVSVGVTGGTGCGWSSTSNASWITVTSGQRAATARRRLSVAANTAGTTPRHGDDRRQDVHGQSGGGRLHVHAWQH